MNPTNYAIIDRTKYENAPAVLDIPRGVAREDVSPMQNHDTPNNNLIPYGYCQCGCGEKTSVIERSNAPRGLVKGEHRRYRSGHHNRLRPSPTKWNEQLDCYEVALFDGDGLTRVALVDADDVEVVKKHRWWVNGHGYVFTNIESTTVRMHRMLVNPGPGMVVDHINHNKLDNRRSNLRAATTQQNNMNRKSAVPGSSSSYLGVSFMAHRDNWVARIRHDGLHIHIGTFGSEVDAAVARDMAALVLHGDFASLNFPSLRDVFPNEHERGNLPDLSLQILKSKIKGVAR